MPAPAPDAKRLGVALAPPPRSDDRTDRRRERSALAS